MKKLVKVIISALLLLNLSCSKEVSTSPEDTYLKNNLLIVESNPQGSLIFLDTRSTGQRTPDTVSWIQTGNHLITLKSTLFKDSSLIVDIKEGEINSIFFDYTTNPTMAGRLNIDSEPRGAEIYLDGINTQFKTPKLIDSLLPGSYEILYKLPGYWDLKVNASVYSGKTITIDKKLNDTLEWVAYNKNTVGLPTNHFNDINIQNGWIKWAGTVDQGLLRYDDSTFVFYNTANSNIPSNFVSSVEVADNGVWIGTNNGAAFLSGESFTIYNTSNSPLLSDDIKDIAEAPDGRVWIATYNKGIFVFNGSNWINYNSSNSPLPTDFTGTVYIDQIGNVWIGTYGAGLAYFDGFNWSVYNSGIFEGRNIRAIRTTIGNDIWAGFAQIGLNTGGAARFRNNGWRFYDNYGTNILSIASDITNTVWLASYETGLVRVSDTGWEIFNAVNSKLLSSRVNSVAIDGSGNKWVTTLNYGIFKYKGN